MRMMHQSQNGQQYSQNAVSLPSLPVQYGDGREQHTAYQLQVQELEAEGLDTSEALFLADLTFDERVYGRITTEYAQELVNCQNQIQDMAEKYSADDVIDLYLSVSEQEEEYGVPVQDRPFVEERLWIEEHMDLMDTYGADEIAEYHVAFEQDAKIRHQEDRVPCVSAEMAWDDSQFPLEMGEVFSRSA